MSYQIINFPFPQEEDGITGEKYFLNGVPLSVNDLYDKNFSTTNSGKNYKKHLSSILEDTNYTPLKSSNIFYSSKFSFVVPPTKKGEINSKFKKDLDNLLKAFQDSLSGKLVEDDQNIQSFFIINEYSLDGETNIELNISDKFQESDFIELKNLIGRTLKDKGYNQKFDISFSEDVPAPLSYNQLFARRKTTKNQNRKGKILNGEKVVKYKEFLKKEMKKGYFPEEILTKNIFYIVKFNLVVPETLKGEVNKTYVNDLDNLLKAFQDGMSGSIFKDDKQVRGIFAFQEYKTTGQTNIEFEIFEFDNNYTLQNLYENVNSYFLEKENIKS